MRHLTLTLLVIACTPPAAAPDPDASVANHHVDGGPVTGSFDGGWADAGGVDAPPGCGATSQPCSSGWECCSGTCTNNQCIAQPVCLPVNSLCSGDDSQCCTGACWAYGDYYACGSCRQLNLPCDSGSDCCSATCTNNFCTGCNTAGEDCSQDSDCCPGTTCLAGVCDKPCGATCKGWLAGTDSYASLCGAARAFADSYISCACAHDCLADATTCAATVENHGQDATATACIQDDWCNTQMVVCNEY
jgi:hypothetical protein